MDLNAIAAIITAVAAAITAVALVARDREQLRQLERLTDLEQRLPEGDTRNGVAEVRDALLTRYAAPRTGFLAVYWAGARMALFGLFFTVACPVILLAVPGLPAWLTAGLLYVAGLGFLIAIVMVVFIAIAGFGVLAQRRKTRVPRRFRRRTDAKRQARAAA